LPNARHAAIFIEASAVGAFQGAINAATPAHHHRAIALGLVVDLALGVGDVFGEEAEIVRGTLHVPLAELAQHDAGVEAFEPREFVGVREHDIVQLHQPRLALLHAQLRPARLERAARGRDRAVDLGGIVFGELAHLHAGRGIEHRQARARSGHGLAGDQRVGLGGRRDGNHQFIQSPPFTCSVWPVT
jgi:hypothetical protein